MRENMEQDSCSTHLAMKENFSKCSAPAVVRAPDQQMSLMDIMISCGHLHDLEHIAKRKNLSGWLRISFSSLQIKT
jgi:hypothetical protein